MLLVFENDVIVCIIVAFLEFYLSASWVLEVLVRWFLGLVRAKLVVSLHSHHNKHRINYLMTKYPIHETLV